MSAAAVFFSAIASLFSFARGAWMFGLGIWVGTAWIFLNSYFLFRLFQISFDPGASRSDRILVLSILKFPVLYVAGFFILKTRVFPVYAILAGLTLFMIAFVFSWARFNFPPKMPQKAL